MESSDLTEDLSISLSASHDYRLASRTRNGHNRQSSRIAKPDYCNVSPLQSVAFIISAVAAAFMIVRCLTYLKGIASNKNSSRRLSGRIVDECRVRMPQERRRNPPEPTVRPLVVSPRPPGNHMTREKLFLGMTIAMAIVIGLSAWYLECGIDTRIPATAEVPAEVPATTYGPAPIPKPDALKPRYSKQSEMVRERISKEMDIVLSMEQSLNKQDIRDQIKQLEILLKRTATSRDKQLQGSLHLAMKSLKRAISNLKVAIRSSPHLELQALILDVKKRLLEVQALELLVHW